MHRPVAPLACRVHPSTQWVIETMARTEDVKFSPNQQCIAVPLFTTNQIAVFRFEIDGHDQARPAIQIVDTLLLDSPALSAPHGLAWIDDSRLVVANRVGRVRVFEVPPAWPASRRVSVKPVKTVWGLPFTRIQHPGSVLTYVDGAGHLQIVVCNNYVDRISRHWLDVAPGVGSVIRVRRHDWLLHARLAIPDGLAISRDQTWLAVSNHGTSQVLVYRLSSDLDVHSDPAAVVDGVDCPHGLCIAPDGRSLLVADAGSPYVHVFQAGNADFAAGDLLHRKVRVLDETTFLRGRGNAQEGGIKGLDISANGAIAVTTCEQQPLAFFQMADFL
jgi:hypothetical protein